MLKWLCLCLAVLGVWGSGPVEKLQTGEWLRFHVIAQDDTAAMQAVKAPVRDAVRAVYAEAADRDASMLENARALLPSLTEAACQAAREQGFAEDVTVSIARERFDTRLLEGRVIPAGTYPALVVRLGEARGHNWWGLIDPEASLRAACCGEAQEGEDSLEWDWSLGAILEALLGYRPAWLGGV